MNFKRRPHKIRALLLSSIAAAALSTSITSPVTAAPVLSRLLDAGPAAIPATPGLQMPSFHLAPADEAPVVDTAPVVKLAAPAPVAPSLAQRMRDQAGNVVSTALNFLGMPYRHGGMSESTGFDCSGFTRYMFEMSAGLVLPRAADQQAKAPGLTAVRRDDLQPGDLVFFNTLRRTFSHVGIYIGDGKFVHAPKPGAEVRVEDMGVAYWAHRFTGARRADPDVDPMAGSALAESADIARATVMSATVPTTVMRSASARKAPHRQVRRRHR